MLLKWPGPVGKEWFRFPSVCPVFYLLPFPFLSFLPGWRTHSAGPHSSNTDGIMKLSMQLVLFFLLGLVASLPLPNKRESQKQYTLVDSGKAVRADPSGYFR